MNFLKQLLTRTCVYYSIFSILLILIPIILKGGINNFVIEILNVLLLFPFSFCLSLAGWLKKNGQFPHALRRLFHYLIVTASILLFLWLPSNTSKGLILGIGIFTLITISYWLVVLICHFTVKRYHNLKEE